MRRLMLPLLAVTLAGCGAGKAQLAAQCSGPAHAIAAAARSGAFADGSDLSDCIANADDRSLPAVATVFAATGDDLAAAAGRGDQAAARALGFLIGATRRGVGGNPSGAELANRLGADARRVHEIAPEMDTLVTRGGAAGRARG